MKTLLDLNSPTYLRRLARELNALTDGFYYKGERYTVARVVSQSGEGGKKCMLILQRPDETDPDMTHSTGVLGTTRLVDAYGREVAASRKAP